MQTGSNWWLPTIYMPEMNGLELYRQIKDEQSDMRFIFITGYSNQEETSRYISEPQTELLQKPFRSQNLDLKVRELLNQD